jgi:hypothetical protein
MGKKFYLLATLALCAVSFADTTFVSGSVSGVWDTSGNPYLVIDSTYISSGDSLIISSGVNVFFQGHFGFLVDSLSFLRIEGSPTDSVLFTAFDTLQNFTGIKFDHASPECEISYCVISRSDCSAIRVFNTELSISNSLLTKNLNNCGGGFYAENSTITISDCIISENKTNSTTSLGLSFISKGGGIACYNSTLFLNNVKVIYNTNRNGCCNISTGGGIYTFASDVELIGCEVSFNSVVGGPPFDCSWEGYSAIGGGIYADTSNILVDASVINENSVYGHDGAYGCYYDRGGDGGSGYGSGIYTMKSNLTLINSIISNNRCFAGLGGGGIPDGSDGVAVAGGCLPQNSTFNIINCTFVENIQSSLYLNTSSGVMLNTIINKPLTLPIQLKYSSLIASHCISNAACLTDGHSTIDWDATNIIGGPSFVNIYANDYHLLPESPCIDAGAESIYVAVSDTVIFAPTSDYEDNPRPRGSGLDIGAFESPYDNICEVVTKPATFSLSVSPNPFNSSCKISAPDGAKISIFDIAGKRVAEIPLAGREAQKNRQCRWKPDNSIGSGIYLVKAKTGEKEITKRVVYLK